MFIQKRVRLAQISALEKAQLGDFEDDYVNFIIRAVDRFLNIYLQALQGGARCGIEEMPFPKIGAFAKRAGVANSTIRHWTKEGLLEVAETTVSGYPLYGAEMLRRIERIQVLKEQRYTLPELREEPHREQ